MNKNKTKKYTNDEMTIVWKPELCIHSGLCVKGLPEVFKPNEQPWINPKAAGTETLITQVKSCPSGALSYFMNNESEEGIESEPKQLIEIMKNGPMLVHGDILVKNPDGTEISKTKRTAFCRCGASANKPFCDGTHKKIEWEDT